MLISTKLNSSDAVTKNVSILYVSSVYRTNTTSHARAYVSGVANEFYLETKVACSESAEGSDREEYVQYVEKILINTAGVRENCT